MVVIGRVDFCRCGGILMCIVSFGQEFIHMITLGMKTDRAICLSPCFPNFLCVYFVMECIHFFWDDNVR